MKHRPTITDVATAAGVSGSTVAKAVNGRYGVASETVDRVYIRLQEVPHAAPPGGAACPAIGQLRAAEVTLEEPLGSRAVVDGATGEIVLQPAPTAPTTR